MAASDRAFNLLALAIGIVSAVTIGLGMFVPIAADEIGWKILQARLALDGGANIHQIAACVGSFATAPPFFMLPFRAVDALLYADLGDPMRLRIGGIAMCLAFVVALLLVARHDDADPQRSRVSRILIVSLLGLGWLPFALIINRPEPPLLLGAALLVLLARGTAAVPPRAWAGDAARGGSVVALSAWMASQNPRAVILAPLMIASAIGAVQRRALRLGAIAVVVALAAASFRYWTLRFACPENAEAAAQILPSLGTSGNVGLGALRWIGGQMAGDWHIGRFIVQLLFDGDRRLRWFEPSTAAGPVEIAANIAIAVVIAAAWVYAAIAVARRLRAIVTARRLSRSDAIVLAIAIAVVALALLQGRRLVYESTLLMGLLALLMPLVLSNWPLRRLRQVTTVLAVVSIASQLVVWKRFIPRVPELVAARGYIAGQPQSISPFNLDATHADIRAASRLCGLHEPERLTHLVVDDATYGAFWAHAYRPFSIGYLRGVWAASIPDLDAFLAERGSAGAILSCHQTPDAWRDRAREHRGFCCHPAFFR